MKVGFETKKKAAKGNIRRQLKKESETSNITPGVFALGWCSKAVLKELSNVIALESCIIYMIRETVREQT